MLCKLENIEIYYETHGEGIPILMIHGFMPDHHILKGCMEPIFQNRSGFKRIYFDLPGMGKTKGKEWIDSSDEILGVIIEFIQNLIPSEKFLIIGQSYGGYLTRGLLHKYPDEILGICLICPLIKPNPKDRILPEFTPIIKNPTFIKQLDPQDREEFEESAIIQNEYVWERFQDEVLLGLKIADIKFLERIYLHKYELSFDVDKLPKKFVRPTLFLLGRQDNSVGYRNALKIIESFPRASYIVLDKAGHLLQIEQQKIFNISVNEWLDRVIETVN
ncbi:MAG: alpha/beta fold hydrolase [Candidatus Odinarchaeota archaeon]